MAKYAINGKFLSQRITGVQRFALETVLELDKVVSKNEIIMLIPRGTSHNLGLKNIDIIEIGRLKGNAWEQVSLPLYLLRHNLTGIHLGNVAPLIKPDYVCIHDMNLVRHPQWFDRKYVIWSKLQYRNSLKRGKKVFTVSNFSKNEIYELYPWFSGQINVVSEGWQHINRINENKEALEKYGLNYKEYYFSLYQSMPNKNFNWIIQAAKHNPDSMFVVSGWYNKKINMYDYNIDEAKDVKNIKMLGYISDEDMKCLLRGCKGFIFPSLYEGFGIPPLEALAVGANVHVSDIPVMREVLGKSAHYVDNTYILDDSSLPNAALAQYSWELTAKQVKKILGKDQSRDS